MKRITAALTLVALAGGVYVIKDVDFAPAASEVAVVQAVPSVAAPTPVAEPVAADVIVAPPVVEAVVPTVVESEVTVPEEVAEVVTPVVPVRAATPGSPAVVKAQATPEVVAAPAEPEKVAAVPVASAESAVTAEPAADCTAREGVVLAPFCYEPHHPYTGIYENYQSTPKPPAVEPVVPADTSLTCYDLNSEVKGQIGVNCVPTQWVDILPEAVTPELCAHLPQGSGGTSLHHECQQRGYLNK